MGRDLPEPDAGTQDTSSSSSGSSPSPNPLAPRLDNPCESFDAGAVHLWGLAGRVDQTRSLTTTLQTIVNELSSAQVCSYGAVASIPKIRPTDNHLLFRGPRRDEEGVQTNVERVFEYLHDEPNEFGTLGTREEVRLEGCEEEGIWAFHIDPQSGDVLFNCKADACYGNAVPFLQDTDACLTGPWFTEDGSEAHAGVVFAIGRDGTYLVEGDGPLAMALKRPGVATPITVAYTGEDIPEGDDRLLTHRAHEDGFWVVLGAWGGARRRFFIDSDGTTTLEGEYPLLGGEASSGWVSAGTTANSWALDEAGDLYEDVGTRVVRSDLEGTSHVEFESEEDQYGVTLYGGVSAYLVTGP